MRGYEHRYLSNLAYQVFTLGKLPARYFIFRSKGGFWVVEERFYHREDNDYTESVLAMKRTWLEAMKVVGEQYGNHYSEVCS